MAHLLKLSEGRVGYGSQSLLPHMNLEIQAGEFIALVGPNGSGKTTLVKTLLGLLPLLEGQLEVNGSTAYIPQKVQMNKSIPLTLMEFLDLHQAPNLQARKQLLHDLELEVRLHQKLNHLSGGFLQRAMLAFALQGEPQLLFLDEASEGMDLKSQQKFYSLIKTWIQNTQGSCVMVSHDISAVTEQVSRVICINTAIHYDGDPRSQEFHSCLHKVYGEGSHIHGHHH